MLLPLKPQLLVSTAIALASWQHQGKPKEAEDDRGSRDDASVADSLRFVQFVGFWSQFTLRSRCSSWPFPRTLAMEELAQIAEQHGALGARPGAGDVFLLGAPDATHHVLAGVIAGVVSTGRLLNGGREFMCTTIEGELKEPGASNDGGRLTTRLVKRQLSPAYNDRFIRWYDLPVQSSPAAIVYELPSNLLTFDRSRLRRAA